jgi:hypothetical protein
MILFVKDATSRPCDGNYLKIMTVPAKPQNEVFLSDITTEKIGGECQLHKKKG